MLWIEDELGDSYVVRDMVQVKTGVRLEDHGREFVGGREESRAEKGVSVAGPWGRDFVGNADQVLSCRVRVRCK
jgi:hypothetical protein